MRAYIAALRELEAHPEWLKPQWNAENPEPGEPGIFLDPLLLFCAHEVAFLDWDRYCHSENDERKPVPAETKEALERAGFLDCLDACVVTPRLARITFSPVLPIHKGPADQRVVEVEVLFRAHPSKSSTTGAHGKNSVRIVLEPDGSDWRVVESKLLWTQETPLARIVVEGPSRLVVKAGETKRFIARPIDAAGDSLTRLFPIEWIARGGAGSINSHGLFYAHGIGQVRLEARPMFHSGRYLFPGEVNVTVELPVEALSSTDSLVSAEEQAIHEALLRFLRERAEPGQRVLLRGSHELAWMERLVEQGIVDAIADPETRPTSLQEAMFSLGVPRREGDQVVVNVNQAVGPGPYPGDGSFMSGTHYWLARTADGWVVVRYELQVIT